MKTEPTVYCLFVDFIHTVIFVDRVLVFLYRISDFSDLVVLVDEVTQGSEISWDNRILRQRLHTTTEHAVLRSVIW